MRRSRGAIIAPLMAGLGVVGIGSAVVALQGESSPVIPLWAVLGPVLGLVLLLLVWVVRSVKDYALQITTLNLEIAALKTEAGEASEEIRRLRDWKYNDLVPKIQVLMMDFTRLRLDSDRQLTLLDKLLERRQEER